jgi:lysozyme-like protein
LAESSGNDQAVGDVNLQNGTWGPSVGLWQIRTLKGQTGSGALRDVSWLTGDVSHQATAMVAISGQGTDWSPWTVYNTGAYQQYLPQARAAAAGDPGSTVPTGLMGSGGKSVVPSVQDVATGAVAAAQSILVRVAAAGLGLVLLGVGVFYALGADQRIRTTRDQQAELRKNLVGV